MCFGQEKSDAERSKINGAWVKVGVSFDGRSFNQEKQGAKKDRSGDDYVKLKEYLNIKTRGTEVQMTFRNTVEVNSPGAVPLNDVKTTLKYDLSMPVILKDVNGPEFKFTAQYKDDGFVVYQFVNETGRQLTQSVFKLDEKGRTLTLTETGSRKVCIGQSAAPDLTPQITNAADRTNPRCMMVNETVTTFMRN